MEETEAARRELEEGAKVKYLGDLPDEADDIGIVSEIWKVNDNGLQEYVIDWIEDGEFVGSTWELRNMLEVVED